MNLLKELNLTPVKKTTGRNPIVLRRESLIKGIDKQLAICESLLTDNEFARDHQTGRVKIPERTPPKMIATRIRPGVALISKPRIARPPGKGSVS